MFRHCVHTVGQTCFTRTEERQTNPAECCRLSVSLPEADAENLRNVGRIWSDQASCRRSVSLHEETPGHVGSRAFEGGDCFADDDPGMDSCWARESKWPHES